MRCAMCCVAACLLVAVSSVTGVPYVNVAYYSSANCSGTPMFAGSSELEIRMQTCEPSDRSAFHSEQKFANPSFTGYTTIIYNSINCASGTEVSASESSPHHSYPTACMRMSFGEGYGREEFFNTSDVAQTLTFPPSGAYLWDVICRNVSDHSLDSSLSTCTAGGDIVCARRARYRRCQRGSYNSRLPATRSYQSTCQGNTLIEVVYHSLDCTGDVHAASVIPMGMCSEGFIQTCPSGFTGFPTELPKAGIVFSFNRDNVSCTADATRPNVVTLFNNTAGACIQNARTTCGPSGLTVRDWGESGSGDCTGEVKFSRNGTNPPACFNQELISCDILADAAAAGIVLPSVPAGPAAASSTGGDAGGLSAASTAAVSVSAWPGLLGAALAMRHM